MSEQATDIDADIAGVRERISWFADVCDMGSCDGQAHTSGSNFTLDTNDLRALLADHARLVALSPSTGEGVDLERSQDPGQQPCADANALAPFWVSWWDDLVVSFELHSPWWFSGCRFHGVEDDDEDLSQSSVCAAVMAEDEDHARRLIREAYDLPVTLEFRFVERRPIGWSPFSDRFRAADWMRWPLADGATAALAPDAAALVEGGLA